MTGGQAATPPRQGETVAMLALLISLVAFSIDSMLPALRHIGDDLGVADPNDAQYIVAVVLFGLAIGQVLYGPLSDSIGRKPAIYAGIGLLLAGCVLSMFATAFPAMLAGRFLQGLGTAAPRIVVVALVRDQYAGRAMARIMSLVMMVFIMVPVVAPLVGQGLLIVASWRAIFGVLFMLALVAVVWFALRQPETLPRERRAPFTLKRISQGVVETCANRAAFGYTIAAGLIFGALVSYLTSCQQIFQDVYGTGALFPVYFGVLSLGIGAASFTNARLVMRFGMRLLANWAARLLALLSLAFLAFAWSEGGVPPLMAALMPYLIACFFCFGVMFGNLNALAMESLGHIAGTAAAVVGSLTTLISVSVGMAVGQAFDGTVLPLVMGFAALGAAAAAVMPWAAKGSGGDGHGS